MKAYLLLIFLLLTSICASAQNRVVLGRGVNDTARVISILKLNGNVIVGADSNNFAIQKNGYNLYIHKGITANDTLATVRDIESATKKVTFQQVANATNKDLTATANSFLLDFPANFNSNTSNFYQNADIINPIVSQSDNIRKFRSFAMNPTDFRIYKDSLAFLLPNDADSERGVHTIASREFVMQYIAANVPFTAGLVVTSSNTLNMTYGTDYVFTGSAATFTLPSISGSISGRQNIITIKNRGSGNITVNANASQNKIYGTSLTNTFTIAAGEAFTLFPDGSLFNVE